MWPGLLFIIRPLREMLSPFKNGCWNQGSTTVLIRRDCTPSEQFLVEPKTKYDMSEGNENADRRTRLACRSRAREEGTA